MEISRKYFECVCFLLRDRQVTAHQITKNELVTLQTSLLRVSIQDHTYLKTEQRINLNLCPGSMTK